MEIYIYSNIILLHTALGFSSLNLNIYGPNIKYSLYYISECDSFFQKAWTNGPSVHKTCFTFISSLRISIINLLIFVHLILKLLIIALICVFLFCIALWFFMCLLALTFLFFGQNYLDPLTYLIVCFLAVCENSYLLSTSFLYGKQILFASECCFILKLCLFL